MKLHFSKKDFWSTLGLASCAILLTSIFFTISEMMFGIEIGMIVGTGIEELVKIGLFAIFRKRAFFAIIFFAVLEILLVKIPVFCWIDFECIAYGVVFSILGFIFHFSTALLYNQIFYNRPNIILFYGAFSGVVLIHIAYNLIDRFIENSVGIDAFCLVCSLVVFGIYKVYNRKRIRSPK
ncbi:MAG: hypothetical protein V7679_03045 [Parasphingorhabdus sp.]